MKVRTETVAGLLFEVPTWDPTPVPWNEMGSWAKDPELEARVLSGLRERIGPERVAELERDALAADVEWSKEKDPCGTYWGSHGCDRAAGHHGLHVCKDCSAIQPITEDPDGAGGRAVLWWVDDDEGLRLSPLCWSWFR